MSSKKQPKPAELRKKIDSLLASAKKPVAIFDLDGTLFNVNYRHMAILKEFIALPEIKENHAEHCAIIAKMRIDDFQYGIETTLNAIGIDRYSEHSAHFVQHAENYWFKRFFTDEFVTCDGIYEKAVECVKHFHASGAQVVYLSGRDVPNMSKGTIEALEKNGFPHRGHNITMLLKPAYGLDDLLFKKQAIDTIRTEGEVIATFDNEPANVQMFIDNFPDAINVHFDSQYARKLDLKGDSLVTIKSFADLGF